MLPLDDKLWSVLATAYGDARRVPKLLGDLEGDRDSWEWSAPWSLDPWGSVWESLCHQGDAYSASYAAVPHVVRMAADRPPTAQLKAIFFVASVEVALHNAWQGESCPPDLEPAYRKGLTDLLPIVDVCERHPWDEADAAAILLMARAAARGWSRAAAAIDAIGDEWSCPHCDASLPSDESDDDGDGADN